MTVEIKDGFGVNVGQKLYVLHEGKGVSCLGFEYAFKLATLMAKEIGVSAPSRDQIGTRAGYFEYLKIQNECERYHRDHGTRSCVGLTPQLVGMEGKRVEVVTSYGEKRRFIVGKSTGWMPCHLEIANRRSHGGGAVSGAPFRSVTVVREDGRARV